MLTSPGLRHQRVLGDLLFSFYKTVDEEKRGLLIGGCGVVLTPTTIVEPDILFVSRERRSILGKEYIEGPPDLIAEVISASSARLDQVLKRRLYARHGVRYYWLVHPLEQWVRAYELAPNGNYELMVEATGDTWFAAQPFLDLPIALGELWDD